MVNGYYGYAMVSSASAMDLTRFVHLDSIKEVCNFPCAWAALATRSYVYEIAAKNSFLEKSLSVEKNFKSFFYQ